MAEPAWGFLEDLDPDVAQATRRQLLDSVARSGALLIGTHFPTRPTGHVVAEGDAWRFSPT
jgi:hypothetical protein